MAGMAKNVKQAKKLHTIVNLAGGKSLFVKMG